MRIVRGEEVFEQGEDAKDDLRRVLWKRTGMRVSASSIDTCRDGCCLPGMLKGAEIAYAGSNAGVSISIVVPAELAQ